MLTEQDYIDAARSLNCEVAAIKAVAKVESRNSGFLADGRPIILYEPHIFHRRTQGRFGASHPHLSYPKQKPGQYGSVSSQWPKLEAAQKLDRTAALESCSWGQFQVMGFHWARLGYSSIDDFVEQMRSAAAAHLDSFVRYVKVFGLASALNRKDWAGFAKGYNGPGYAVNRYDVRMAQAYREFSR